MNFLLHILFASIGFFGSDIITYLFLKYIKKDKAIDGVKYSISWWHYYFTNKYKECDK